MVAKSPEGAKGAEQLKEYWLAGPGLKKWATTAKPWTHLYRELLKYLPEPRAKETASRWFIEHFGYAAGSDKNRVAHGHPPRGKAIGPG